MNWKKNNGRKITIQLALKLLLSMVLCAQLQAQTPDFTGTWTLNLEKSSLASRPEGLTNSIFIIRQKGNRFRLTRYHIVKGKKKKIRFKMIADGKTRSVKILFKGKLEWIDNDLKASIWRKNFSNIVTYHYDEARNELIADEVFTGYPKDHHNIWVFEKVTAK